MFRAFLIGALAVSLATGCPQTETCTEFGQAFASISPSGGDGFVPTDSSIWVRLDTEEPSSCFFFDLRLVNLDEGREGLVDSSTIEAPGRLLLGFEPTDGLAADADYEVEWSVNRPGSRTGVPVVVDSGVVSFTTDSGPALLPPAVPEGIGWKAEVDGARLGFDPQDATDYDDWLELWATSGRFLLVQTSEPGEGLPEEVWRLGEFGHVWSDAVLPPGRRLDLRFAALGLNGMLSEWSEGSTLPVPMPANSDQGGF